MYIPLEEHFVFGNMISQVCCTVALTYGSIKNVFSPNIANNLLRITLVDVCVCIYAYMYVHMYLRIYIQGSA